MRRFVTAHTLLSQVLMWFFIATLFSDEANLDDLVCGHLVLHDGDEVVHLGMNDGANPPMCWARCCSTGATALRQSLPLSQISVRIILDQDSPSATAVAFQTVSNSLPILEDSPTVSFDHELPVGLLHLRYHRLLI